MKKLIALIILLTTSTTLFAQFDAFGAPAPQNKNAGVKSGKNFTDSKGLKQGEWEKRSADGNLIYKATFKDDKPIGTMTRYYPNGRKKVVIEYDSISDYGAAQLFDEKEQLFAEGMYNKTVKDSTWLYYDVLKNVVCRESYSNGLLNGPTAYFYQNGAVFELLNYKNGIKDGEWRQYYRDGKDKLTCQYNQGKLVGAFKVLYASGTSEVIGFYKNGVEEGVWKFYKPDGKVDYEIKYKGGKILNADEIDTIKSNRLKELEKNKNNLKDPEKYRNDPDGYMLGN